MTMQASGSGGDDPRAQGLRDIVSELDRLEDSVNRLDHTSSACNELAAAVIKAYRLLVWLHAAAGSQRQRLEHAQQIQAAEAEFRIRRLADTLGLNEQALSQLEEFASLQSEHIEWRNEFLRKQREPMNTEHRSLSAPGLGVALLLAMLFGWLVDQTLGPLTRLGGLDSTGMVIVAVVGTIVLGWIYYILPGTRRGSETLFSFRFGKEPNQEEIKALRERLAELDGQVADLNKKISGDPAGSIGKVAEQLRMRGEYHAHVVGLRQLVTQYEVIAGQLDRFLGEMAQLQQRLIDKNVELDNLQLQGADASAVEAELTQLEAEADAKQADIDDKRSELRANVQASVTMAHQLQTAEQAVASISGELDGRGGLREQLEAKQAEREAAHQAVRDVEAKTAPRPVRKWVPAQALIIVVLGVTWWDLLDVNNMVRMERRSRNEDPGITASSGLPEPSTRLVEVTELPDVRLGDRILVTRGEGGVPVVSTDVVRTDGKPSHEIRFYTSILSDEPQGGPK